MRFIACFVLTAFAPGPPAPKPPEPGVPPHHGVDIDAEPNNSFAHAVPLTLPLAEGHGCIEPAGDEDYFTFTLFDNSPLFIHTKSKSAESFNISLFDAKHMALGQGAGVLNLANVDSGTYFVRLSAAAKGCYEMQIFAESRQPPLG